MKQIEIRGEFSPARERPAALDLAARASLCLDHML